MLKRSSRRRFLSQTLQTVGFLGLAMRPSMANAADGRTADSVDRKGRRLPPAPPGGGRELVGRPQGARHHGLGGDRVAPLEARRLRASPS